MLQPYKEKLAKIKFLPRTSDWDKRLAIRENIGANVPGLCVGRDTERDFYLFEILKLPIKFYVSKCPPDAKDLLCVALLSVIVVEGVCDRHV